MPDLNTQEREYLVELLKNAHEQMLHELHHTDTRTFEASLKDRVQLNEAITKKLQS